MGIDWGPKCPKTSGDGCTAVTTLETIVLDTWKCVVSTFLEVLCASTWLSVCLEEAAVGCHCSVRQGKGTVQPGWHMFLGREVLILSSQSKGAMEGQEVINHSPAKSLGEYSFSLLHGTLSTEPSPRS